MTSREATLARLRRQLEKAGAEGVDFGANHSDEKRRALNELLGAGEIEWIASDPPKFLYRLKNKGHSPNV